MREVACALSNKQKKYYFIQYSISGLFSSPWARIQKKSFINFSQVISNWKNSTTPSLICTKYSNCAMFSFRSFCLIMYISKYIKRIKKSILKVPAIYILYDNSTFMALKGQKESRIAWYILSVGSVQMYRVNVIYRQQQNNIDLTVCF